ncbi:MAG: hypothetical protein OXN94_04295 [Chloroflexota bacterium]|nr:hypothetical protein [Chloroflexota bacterium]MDE2857052.1 hypothetical protein [Chloroflexota bacterium]MDE2950749.1 hypothetical protein [Chloroflexota bacterium]
MMIDIPQDLALRLEDLAETKGSTVEELLRTWLDGQEAKKPQLTMQDLARNAREAGLKSDKPVDTSERSREILNAEFANWVDRRIRE